MKSFIFIIILLFVGELTYGKKLETVSSKNDISKVIKLWGFLKYYSPNVRKGNVNWDNVFLNNIDGLLADSLSYNEIFNKMISLSPPPEDMIKKNTKHKTVNIDFNFLDECFHDNKLLIQRFLNNNEIFTSQSYHAKINYLEFVDFRNDKKYKPIYLNKESYRLLCLAKYWNRIKYFWPNKQWLKVSWEDILDYAVEKSLTCSTSVSFENILIALNFSLNDSHALHYLSHYYIDSITGPYVNDVLIEECDNKFYIGAIYDNKLSGTNLFLVGDEIIKTPNGDILRIKSLVDTLCPFSFLETKVNLISEIITHSKTKISKYTVVRDGDTVNIRVSGNPYLTSSNLIKKEIRPDIIPSNIGYINASLVTHGFKAKREFKQFHNQFEKDTIIIDLRHNYNSDAFEIFICKKIFPRDFYDSFYCPGKEYPYPGYYVCNKKLKYGSRGKNQYNGHIILLVDKSVGSLGESTAMLIQSYDKITTVGTKTWGANGLAIDIDFGIQGISSMITIAKVLNKDNIVFSRKGVNLDMEFLYSEITPSKKQDLVLSWVISKVLK